MEGFGDTAVHHSNGHPTSAAAVLYEEEVARMCVCSRWSGGIESLNMTLSITMMM